jgi:methionyl-tRNA formyltransferase
MKKMSKKIVFFGNERLATGVTTKNPVMKKLVDAGFVIDCLILNQDAYNSRNLRTLEAEEFANLNNIKVHKPSSIDEVKKIVAESGCEIAVLVAYGKLIPESVIEMFPLGIINIHPSLLPDKRGSTPIEQTILDGDKIAGVSLMRLAKGMDSGPIYDQIRIEISGKESKQELSDLLNRAGADLLAKNLNDIIGGDLKPVEQPTEGVTVTKQLNKTDGIIDWKEKAAIIERKCRAYQGWPKLKTVLFSKNVDIEQVEVGEKTLQEPGKITADKDSLKVAALGDEIEIISLKPENKKSMSGKAFIAGYKK